MVSYLECLSCWLVEDATAWGGGNVDKLGSDMNLFWWDDEVLEYISILIS